MPRASQRVHLTGARHCWQPRSALAADAQVVKPTIDDATSSGRDLLYWGPLWPNHEVGHLISLPDLYDYAPPSGRGIHLHVGDWSMMGLISLRGAEDSAFDDAHRNNRHRLSCFVIRPVVGPRGLLTRVAFEARRGQCAAASRCSLR
jgi:hypothetical protein